MIRLTTLSLIVMLTIASMSSARIAAQSSAIRQIPGVTSKDAYPNGCVDCHVAGKDGDMRMSVLFMTWTKTPSAALVAKAKAASVDPAKVKGKHPPMTNVKASLPQTCLVCHKKGSTIAPAFAQLMHSIHLFGGTQNRFLTANQGECTHCHKLDQKTGAWKVATGPEK